MAWKGSKPMPMKPVKTPTSKEVTEKDKAILKTAKKPLTKEPQVPKKPKKVVY